MDVALAAGADDLARAGDYFEVTCDAKVFDTVKKALEEAKVPVESAEITYIPSTWVDLDPDNAKRMARLRDIFDENEDVQAMYANDTVTEGAISRPDDRAKTALAVRISPTEISSPVLCPLANSAALDNSNYLLTRPAMPRRSRRPTASRSSRRTCSPRSTRRRRPRSPPART